MTGLLSGAKFHSKLAVVGVLGAVTLMGGCGIGIRLDMQDQPKYKPLRQSDFFADGRSARPLPENTVARGQERADVAFYTGKVNNQYVGDFPVKVDEQLVARGQERFNVYCSPCHSRLGDGNGMIVQRGLRRPPSFHEQRLRQAPVGHFYDVITNGFGSMGDYAQQVSVRDRWAIVAYIRALQFSTAATQGDVPAGMQVSNSMPNFNEVPKPESSNVKGTHGEAQGQGGGNPEK